MVRESASAISEEMSTLGEFRLGQSDVRFESGLIFVRPHGSMKEEQLPQALEFMKRSRDEHGQVFLLVDMREGERLPPAMRRALAEMLTVFGPTATGVYGASVEQRAGHAMLMGAVAGMSGQRPNVAYFETEAEARQWLAGERQRIHGT